jgi:hypothetical protein
VVNDTSGDHEMALKLSQDMDVNPNETAFMTAPAGVDNIAGGKIL